MKAILSDYLGGADLPEELTEAMAQDGEPFRRGGRTFVIIQGRAGLLTAVNRNGGRKWDHTELSQKLRLYGAEPKTEHYKKDGRDTTKSVWQLPELDEVSG